MRLGYTRLNQYNKKRHQRGRSTQPRQQSAHHEHSKPRTSMLHISPLMPDDQHNCLLQSVGGAFRRRPGSLQTHWIAVRASVYSEGDTLSSPSGYLIFTLGLACLHPRIILFSPPRCLIGLLGTFFLLFLTLSIASSSFFFVILFDF